MRPQDVVGPRLFSRRAGGESKTYISGLNIDKTSQQMNLIQTGSDEFDLLILKYVNWRQFAKCQHPSNLSQVLELQNTLDDLTHRVDKVNAIQ